MCCYCSHGRCCHRPTAVGAMFTFVACRRGVKLPKLLIIPGAKCPDGTLSRNCTGRTIVGDPQVENSLSAVSLQFPTSIHSKKGNVVSDGSGAMAAETVNSTVVTCLMAPTALFA